MIRSDKNARQLYEELKAAPPHARIGFGARPALINVDLQRRYTDKAAFKSAYENDPRQIEYVNRLAALFRAQGLPVVWTYVAYLPGGVDCGWWGTRSRSPNAIQNVTHGSEQAELDRRLVVDAAHDLVLHKRMSSSFFETHLASYLVFNQIDTLVVTGGATSGCVRCTVIDGMSRGYRMIVPEECVADRHESPHFSTLYDMVQKYADVIPVGEAFDAIAALTPQPAGAPVT